MGGSGAGRGEREDGWAGRWESEIKGEWLGGGDGDTVCLESTPAMFLTNTSSRRKQGAAAAAAATAAAAAAMAALAAETAAADSQLSMGHT